MITQPSVAGSPGKQNCLCSQGMRGGKISPPINHSTSDTNQSWVLMHAEGKDSIFLWVAWAAVEKMRLSGFRCLRCCVMKRHLFIHLFTSQGHINKPYCKYVDQPKCLVFFFFLSLKRIIIKLSISITIKAEHRQAAKLLVASSMTQLTRENKGEKIKPTLKMTFHMIPCIMAVNLNGSTAKHIHLTSTSYTHFLCFWEVK